MRLTRKRSRAPAILFSEQFPEKSNPGLVVPHCAPCPLHWCSDKVEANPKPQECCFEQPLLPPVTHRAIVWHSCWTTAGEGLFFSSLHAHKWDLSYQTLLTPVEQRKAKGKSGVFPRKPRVLQQSQQGALALRLLLSPIPNFP